MACHQNLCPGCLVEVELRPTAYVRCGPCGAAVEVLTRPGSDVSFARALRGALRLAVGLPGLLLVFALAAAAAELDRQSSPLREGALLLWSAAAWLVGVAIVRTTAEGQVTLQGAPANAWPELVRPALLLAALTAPALAVPRTGFLGAGLVVLATPLLVPLALGVLSLRPLREALSPAAAIRRLRELGQDGARAVACVLAVWLFARMLGGLAEAPPTEVPGLWTKTLGALGAFSLFLVPRVLGLLVETRGEALDYPFRTARAVPVLPGARAEVRVPYQPPAARPRARPEPISLEETSAEEPFAPRGPKGT